MYLVPLRAVDPTVRVPDCSGLILSIWGRVYARCGAGGMSCVTTGEWAGGSGEPAVKHSPILTSLSTLEIGRHGLAIIRRRGQEIPITGTPRRVTRGVAGAVPREPVGAVQKVGVHRRKWDRISIGVPDDGLSAALVSSVCYETLMKCSLELRRRPGRGCAV